MTYTVVCIYAGGVCVVGGGFRRLDDVLYPCSGPFFCFIHTLHLLIIWFLIIFFFFEEGLECDRVSNARNVFR